MTRNRNRIKYRNFWNGFRGEEFFFERLVTDLSLKRKLLVVSVFESPFRRFLKKLRYWSQRLPGAQMGAATGKYQKKSGGQPSLKIWWTGENIRPPLTNDFHRTISFDFDDYLGKNLYFPLFYSELMIPSPSSHSRVGVESWEAAELLQSRTLNEQDSRKFVCAFINNPEPTRIRALQALSHFGQVDVFGSLSGKKVPTKYDLAKNYKFTLCFENDLFPGYVTEKLLDAYLCGTVPLWWGLLGNEKHINRRSFINAVDFDSMQAFAEYVANLKPDQYQKIYQEPLMSSLPDLEAFYGHLFGD